MFIYIYICKFLLLLLLLLLGKQHTVSELYISFCPFVPAPEHSPTSLHTGKGHLHMAKGTRSCTAGSQLGSKAAPLAISMNRPSVLVYLGEGLRNRRFGEKESHREEIREFA